MLEALGAAVTGVLESPSALVQLALGALLLLFGRRLFWLLVAVLGFAAGLFLADVLLSPDAATWRWAAALLCGVLGALAAVFLQRAAITVGGALAAGYSAHWYLSLTHQPLEQWHWLVVAGAAILGLLVARVVVDVALIAVSTLAGATLLVQGADLEPEPSRWLFFALLVLGAVVQGSALRARRARGSSGTKT